MSSGTPLLLSPLIGRARELERIDALFGEGARLVTLIGPPGIGKTRLAAAHLDRARRGGAEVAWVELGTATRRDDVAGHLAGALGLKLGLAHASELAAELAWAVAGRASPRLYFDEAERCVAPLAELLPAWLAAGDARAVVTSRERLRLPGEAVVEIGPLAIDGDEPEDVLASPAGRLLLQRAGVEDPGARAAALSELVRVLEGVPLIIELVAARLALMKPEEVLERLTRGTVLDTRPLRGRATLREAIDGSWCLLEPEEQRALACCAVFRSAFTVTMAEEVIGEDGAVRALEGLRDKSLITRELGPDARLRLYAPVRAFASERLAELGVEEAARARYVGACASLAERCAARWAERSDPDALGALVAMVDDLRAAFAEARGAARAHLALGLAAVFGTRGPQADALAPLEDVREEELDDRLAARVALAHARALSVSGRVSDALDVLGRAAERTHGDAEQSARFSTAEAELELARGALDASRAAAERARRAAPSESAAGVDALRASALAWHASGRLEEAFDAYERAHRAALERGHLRRAATLRSDLATVRLQQRRLAEARELFEVARAELDPETDPVALGLAEGNLAILEQELGRLEEAEALFVAGIERLRRVGHRLFVAHLTGYAGALAHERGRHAEAVARYRSALATLRAVGDARLTAVVASLLGAAEAARDRLDAAREAFDEAEGALSRVDDPGVVHAVEVHRGHLDLASGRAGVVGSDEARRRAAARVGEGPVASDDVRLARRLLRAALGLGALGVDHAQHRLTLPDGAVRDLGTRAVLWRLVEALAARRRDAPGTVLTPDELIAAAWPGEHLTGSSGPNRLKVALSTLRKLGLRDILLLIDGGYLLSPDIPLVEMRN